MKCEACDHENIDGARFCAGCGVQLPQAHDPSSDPLIGQVIAGRFRVTRVLGEGGMGIVYEGEQPMGSAVRKVAIKTLHQHLSKDPSVLARFHRECGTVAQLEHPNTIKVYDFGTTDDGTLYIAMEFVSGRALSDAIETSGKLPADRVVTIMRQVCGALEEAHQQGIVHRDLKPENIILTSRAGEVDFVKVLDFGIAGRTESADASKEAKLTQQGMVLGTPPYMSPEQFTGKALDGRSDVYSLGVVAYEMLTGRLPFDAETPWEWATQHMTAQPKPLEELVAHDASIPAPLKQAIMRALAKDREQRPGSVREFYAELSDGGPMTMERPTADAPSGHAPTAAMAAAPDFGAQVVPTTAMPQTPAAGMSPGPMGSPQPVAAVAGPPPKRSGSKGILLALGGLGLVGAIVLLIVVVRSKAPDEDEPELTSPLATTGEALGEAAEIKPLATVENVATGGSEMAVAQATQASASSPGSNGSAAPGSPSGSHSPTGSATAATPATTPASTSTNDNAPTSAPSAADTCDLCMGAARSGNVPAAASAYRSCSDAAKKARCANQVKRSAPAAAKRAAFNGQCPAAQAIVRGARAMGAGSPALDSALSGTSCQ